MTRREVVELPHALECPMGLDCICGANNGRSLDDVLAEDARVAGEDLEPDGSTG